MLATVHDDTWSVLNMKHIAPYLKRWDYSDIPGVCHEKIKEPAHMVEGGHHLRKAHNPHPLRNQGISRHGVDPQNWNILSPPSGELKFQHCIKIASFDVWVRYFARNFKGAFWNSTKKSCPHIERCVVYWEVKLWELLTYKLISVFGIAPWFYILTHIRNPTGTPLWVP